MTKTYVLAAAALIVSTALVFTRMKLADEQSGLSDNTRILQSRLESYDLAEVQKDFGDMRGALITIRDGGQSRQFEFVGAAERGVPSWHCIRRPAGAAAKGNTAHLQ